MAAVAARKLSAPDNAIATLHRGAFGKVEFLRCDGTNQLPVRAEIATHLHFSLPLAGSFVWHVGRESVFADPTALLCTQAGDAYRITHPNGGDHSLVFTPSAYAITQLSERAERVGLAYRHRTLRASAQAQLLAYALCFDPLMTRDSLTADECLLQLFEGIALGEDRQQPPRDDALVRRALEYIHHTAEPMLTLSGIASAMDVRAAYLTTAFAQRFGLPLYRYIMKLKLARALHRIAASADDLTHIALELGFSSHSHLSAVFKARYGLSPSALREQLRHTKDSGKLRSGSVLAHKHRGMELNWRPLCAARGGMPSFN